MRDTMTINLADADWVHQFMRILGDEIRRRRKGRGWTREELRERLTEAISHQTLATYELGTRKITVVRLLDIAEALDTTPADIVACAYTRVFDDLDRAIGWIVDLKKSARLDAPELAPLRTWAKFRLAELPPGQPKTALLTRPALDALATLCGVEPKTMVERLPRGDLAAMARATQTVPS